MQETLLSKIPKTAKFIFDEIVSPQKELSGTENYYKVKTFNSFVFFAIVGALINFLIRIISTIESNQNNTFIIFDSFLLIIIVIIFFLLGKSKYYNLGFILFPFAPLGSIWIYYVPFKADPLIEHNIFNPIYILIIGLVVSGLLYSIKTILVFLVFSIIDMFLFYGPILNFSIQWLLPRFLILLLVGVFMIMHAYFRLVSFKYLNDSNIKLSKEVEITQRNLTDERAILYSLIGNLKEGVIIIDNNNFPVIVNNNFINLYREITKGEFTIDNKINEFINKDNIFSNFLLKLNRNEHTVSQIYENKDQSYLLIGNHLKIKNEFKILGKMIEIHNITELKMVDILEKRFRKTIMHELRTPTTSLQLSISNLSKYWDKISEEDKLKLIRSMEKQSLKFSDIIKKVSTITDLEDNHNLNFSEININSFILDFKNLFVNSKTNHDIKITSLINTNLLVNINMKLIMEAINNILDNAMKFSKKGSEILIKFYLKNDTDLIIEISDQGIGIEESEIPFIFNRFYKGKNAENLSGEGLGLSISREIILLHNGKIFVRSKIDQGTTVEISLPIMNESILK